MSKRTVELDLATPAVDAHGQPTRVPLTIGGEAADEPDLGGEHLLVNMGPQHPATHGVLRLVVELDGETVVRCIPHLGYLHSGFEKLGEYRHYNQIIPLTDRTDYLSPMSNNVGFALAAEKLMGIETTPRCTVLRVIACEMSRIISHMVWLGTTSIDLGAFTPFLWAFQERERIYDLQEMWTGARLTTSVTRVGGLMADIPDDRKSIRLNSSHSQISYAVFCLKKKKHNATHRYSLVHFFAACAAAMSGILVANGRRQQSGKSGGQSRRIAIDCAGVPYTAQTDA